MFPQSGGFLFPPGLGSLVLSTVRHSLTGVLVDFWVVLDRSDSVSHFLFWDLSPNYRGFSLDEPNRFPPVAFVFFFLFF